MKIRIQRRHLKILLPVGLLAVGVLAFVGLARSRPPAELLPPQRILPPVETIQLGEAVLRTQLSSQGSVRAVRETQLMARVSGRVEWLAPQFDAGYRVAAGDALLGLDRLPYESALAEAQARVQRSEMALAQERAAARQAERDWAGVGRGEADALVLRVPQLRSAEAELAAAQAALRMAERNLADTVLRAPYAGRIRQRSVALGDVVVASASPLGQLFSDTDLEVMLPLALREAALITDPQRTGEPLTVRLRAQVGGHQSVWNARMDRFSGTVDPLTRLTGMYVRLEEVDAPNGMALAPGMFVEAEIPVRLPAGVHSLPRAALHEGNRVYRMDADNRLWRVAVELVHSEQGWISVEGDLHAGDRLVTTPLLIFTDGMEVAPVATASSTSADTETEMVP